MPFFFVKFITIMFSGVKEDTIFPCINQKRGCKIELPHDYIKFHEDYLCPFKKVENRKMFGQIHLKTLTRQKKPFIKFDQTWFLIRHSKKTTKLSVQNLPKNVNFEISFKDKDGNYYTNKIKINHDNISQTYIIPHKYFKEVPNNILKFKITMSRLFVISM